METQRTKTWYKKFFRHLLNQAVLNSYILYKKNDDAPKLNHVQFVMKLTERLLEMYHTPKQAQPRGRPSLDSASPLRDISQCTFQQTLGNSSLLEDAKCVAMNLMRVVKSAVRS